MLSIKRAGHDKAEQLYRIQKEAFQEDLAAYQDFDTNPACESVERMKAKIEAYDYYAVFFHNEMMGGAAIQRKANAEYRISPLYLLPAYHNKGLGTQLLHELFTLYPDARVWSLSTPKPNKRNSYFYEKHGFVAVGELYVNERLTLTHYRKEIQLP